MMISFMFSFKKFLKLSHETGMKRWEKILFILGFILLYWPVCEHFSDLRKNIFVIIFSI